MITARKRGESIIKILLIMAGFGWDAGKGQAQGNKGDMYVVLQVVLTEKLMGTGSGISSLTNLQATINQQAAKGYRLHTITTT